MVGKDLIFFFLNTEENKQVSSVSQYFPIFLLSLWHSASTPSAPTEDVNQICSFVIS